MAEELKPSGVCKLAVSPGFLRSEEMLDYFGVTEANWQDAVHSGKPHAEHFDQSETPRFLGRGMAALSADPELLSLNGRGLPGWELSDRYNITDIDGRRPHWGNYAKQHGFL
ncbi:hypothetical protein [Paenibacillus chungangensis]|uniref:Uncharacterized protein n=1 Tax=Paenibacillus chungangensis TaxID=696535 RepID=A0ABW3HS40_9BACL